MCFVFGIVERRIVVIVVDPKRSVPVTFLPPGEGGESAGRLLRLRVPRLAAAPFVEKVICDVSVAGSSVQYVVDHCFVRPRSRVVLVYLGIRYDGDLEYQRALREAYFQKTLGELVLRVGGNEYTLLPAYDTVRHTPRR